MRILFATDGSEGAKAAARFLDGFAHRRDVHVHIVTLLGDEEKAEGERILEEARAALGDFPGHVTTSVGWVLTGTSEVIELITLNAREIGADLIALGTRGLSPFVRFFVGSVAEGVARYAPCSVLLARPDANDDVLDRVVVGIDGSEEGAKVVAWLGEHLPLPTGCEVTLTGVVPPVEEVERRAPDIPFLRLGQRLAEAGRVETGRIEAALEDARTTLDKHGWTTAATKRESVRPADALIDAATEGKADLICVGSRGQTNVERVLLGSVSENILRSAPCSVLIVRPKAATGA